MDIEQQFFLGEVGLARFPEVLPQVKRPLIVTRGTVKELYLFSVVSAVASGAAVPSEEVF